MPSSEAGERGRGGGALPVAIAWLAVIALPAIVVAIAWLAVVAPPAIVLAADPSESPGGGAGDPRSSGQGPGLVGNPGWALVIVLVIGITTLLVTLAYVRLTASREASGDR